MAMRLRVATAVVVLVVGLVVIAKVAGPDPPPLTDIASLVAADGSPSKRGAAAVIGTLAERPERQVGATEWWFRLQEGSQSLRVRYRGVVPSTFRKGASVLVVGRMQGDTFAAERLAVRTEM
jgi:cytochrome c-type biogenesis protein CcmE